MIGSKQIDSGRPVQIQLSDVFNDNRSLNSADLWSCYL